MRNAWILTKIRVRLALRNRAFAFFSLIMPMVILFVYAAIFGRGEAGSVTYLMPAVLAITVMGSFWGLSIQLVLFREQGVLRRFRLAPVGPFSMLISSIISNYVLTLPTLVIQLVLAKLIWHVPSLGNLGGVFIFLTLGIVTFAAFGLIVASVTNSMQETQIINNLIWMAFLFLSGATLPLVFFPNWLQRASVFLPATHLIIGLQYTFIAAAPVWKVKAEIIALIGGSAMALFVSTKVFRWEPEERIPRRGKLLAAAVAVPFLLLGFWENAQGTRRSELQSIYNSAMQRGMPSPNAAPAPQPPAQTPPQNPPH